MPAYNMGTASPILKEQFDKTVVDAITDRKTTFSWFMKNVAKVDINARGYYFAAQTDSNQGYGSNTSAQEGGIMPRSGTPGWKKIRADYATHFLAGEMSGEVLEAKDDAALLGLSKNYLVDAEKSFTNFQDFYLFGNGSGSRGVTSTAYVVGTPTVLTFALSQTRPYGSSKLRRKQRLQFIDPATGLQRTGGGVTVSTVLSVDTNTDVVTFDAVPSDVAVNDIVVIEDTYGREVQGFDFHLNDSNGNWLKDGETGVAIPKATNPWTKASVRDGLGADLSPQMLDLISAQSQNNQGDGEVEYDAVMLSHIAQQEQYRKLGYALTRTVEASGNKMLDLGFGKVSHNGMVWRTSSNCQPDRVYGLKMSSWRMPFLKLPQMYKYPSGGSLIQKPATDRYYDAVQFNVYSRHNIVCVAPFENWLLKNLAFDPSVVRSGIN